MIVTGNGRLVKDPELAEGNGKIYTKFSVAYNTGKDKTTFLNCIAWGEWTADFLKKYFKKGKPIFISGRLESNVNDGVTYFQCVIDKVDFVPATKSNDNDEEPLW